MNRLFTFGCSFTNYRWSTWADCLAPEFDYFENWGQAGAGNHYIFNSVMEADQRHNFSDGDTVVVCWTNVLREDRYTTCWQTHGNAATNNYYNDSYCQKYITERGCLIRDLALIKGVIQFLKSIPGIKFKLLSMCPLLYPDQYKRTETEYHDIKTLYSNVLKEISLSFYETVLRKDWELKWETNRMDLHPTPAEHLTYLDTVLPGWVTKTETRAKIQEESINLRNNTNPAKSGLSKVTRL
jgi:hypothetical protein